IGSNSTSGETFLGRVKKGISFANRGASVPSSSMPIRLTIVPASKNRFGQVAVIGPKLISSLESSRGMKFRIEQTPPFLLQFFLPLFGPSAGTSSKNGHVISVFLTWE